MYSILVNKENLINENYTPLDLVSVGKIYSSENGHYTDEDIFLEKTAATNLRKMLDAANMVDSSIRVIPDSGYRSYQYQVDVLNYYIEKEGTEKAYKRVALPGTSEHHTGLAVDVAIFDNGKYIDDVSGDEDTIKFLHENCYKYGFILRYPKDKEHITGYAYEPWHFRYVGFEIAKEIMLNNLTLEEWHEKNTSLG